jgi:eukaryotic-like serine/threonine-protein kinase
MGRTGRRTFTDLALESGLANEKQISESMKQLDDRRLKGESDLTLEKVLIEQKIMSETDVKGIHIALDRLLKDEKKTEVQRIGNYEIIDKIGEGGLGVVYRANQVSMDRVVALKVLHKKWLTDDEFKKRFLLEARLAGRLQHQNLIQVFDVGRDRGFYYFSMEFIEGETAEDMIERDGPLSTDRALDYTAQCLRAIAFLRRHKLVHRDIKPSNMLINQYNELKLGDFGFIKTKLDKIISDTGEVLGTPDYIAPEQAMGQVELDWRSDEYGLGASLYHMLAGRPPFEGSGSQVMRQHIVAELPDPRAYNKDIPERVVHVLERMMAKDREHRYLEPEELLKEIDRIRQGQDPMSERLDSGLSTIMRSVEEKDKKIQKTREDRKRLEDVVEKQLKIIVGLSVVCAILLIALIIALASR